MTPINKIVELKLGYSCTQNCTFCCFKDIKGFNMTNEEIEKNLQYIFNNIKNPDVFILSGGEPTLYKSFWNILDFIKTKINARKIVIHTNGLFFADLNNANKIKNYQTTLMVSFHTLNENFYKTHISKICDVKDLEQAIINLERNKIEFITNTLIFKDNVNELQKIAEFLTNHSVKQMEFRVPYAFSKLIDKNIFLIQDFEKVLKNLYDICIYSPSESLIKFHPSSICLIAQFTKNNEMINYLKRFCEIDSQKFIPFFFIDKRHQESNLIKSNTQISAVMSNYKKYFFEIPSCKKCNREKICHGLPVEYKLKLQNKDTKTIFKN